MSWVIFDVANQANGFFSFSKIIFFATMRLRLGVGAVGLVLFKHVKPSAQVRALHPNLEHGAQIENCVVLRKETKKISCREQDAVIFRCEELLGDLELHTVICWFLVTQEGPSEDFFDQATIPSLQGVSKEAKIPTSAVAEVIERLMFVPRKPRPFGNEWHTICCCLSGVFV